MFVPQIIYVSALDSDLLLALWTRVGERVISPAWNGVKQGLTLSAYFPLIKMLHSSALIHDPLPKLFFFYI